VRGSTFGHGARGASPSLRAAWISLILSAVAAHAEPSQGEWFIGKRVEDFVFAGLSTVKSQDLRPIVRGYVGRPFSWDLLWEVQAKLYELDYFEDIGAEAREGAEGRQAVVLVLNVRERLSVTRVEVDGNRHVTRAAILERIKLKTGDFVSAADLKTDSAAVKSLYEEKGYPNAEVNASQAPDHGHDRAVVVTYGIREGGRVGVSEIRFAGNGHASADSLRSRIRTRSRGLFNQGVLREDQLREDVAAIESWYRSEGFVDARVLKVDRDRVRGDRDGQDEASDLVLTLYIEEGRRYRYGGVRYTGNSVFADDRIDALLRLKPGEFLDGPAADAQVRRISDLYAGEGYVYTSVAARQIRDDQASTISYEITIVERDKAYIENIVLKGNKKTMDHVILRELPFSAGEVFDSSRIRQGYLNLSNLQYFSAIDIAPSEGSADGLIDLVISVEEQSWANFTFGLSFSGGDFPVSGQVGWSDSNVGGTGRSATANLEVSSSRQGVALSFNDACLFTRNWGGGASVSVYHKTVEDVPQDILAPIFWDDDVPDPYDDPEAYDDDVDDGDVEIPDSTTMTYDSMDISLGVSTSFVYPTLFGRLTAKTSLSSTFTCVTYDDEIYRPYSSLVRDNLRTWLPINSLTSSVGWDTRDFQANPTRGYYVSEMLQYTGGLLSGSRDYIKEATRADGFVTLFDFPLRGEHSLTAVLAAHTSLSLLLPQFDGELNVATSDTLTVDGSTIGRGWDYQADYYGMWDSVLELRIPIARRFLWWTWFAEGTGAWSAVSEMARMSEGDFYLSWGGGLRLTIPGLPIRLYLAQPFRVQGGRIELEHGGIPLGDLDLSLVFAISIPGDF
jgi:outer membrane protein insertion porin family